MGCCGSHGVSDNGPMDLSKPMSQIPEGRGVEKKGVVPVPVPRKGSLPVQESIARKQTPTPVSALESLSPSVGASRRSSTSSSRPRRKTGGPQSSPTPKNENDVQDHPNDSPKQDFDNYDKDCVYDLSQILRQATAAVEQANELHEQWDLVYNSPSADELSDAHEDKQELAGFRPEPSAVKKRRRRPKTPPGHVANPKLGTPPVNPKKEESGAEDRNAPKEKEEKDKLPSSAPAQRRAIIRPPLRRVASAHENYSPPQLEQAPQRASSNYALKGQKTSQAEQDSQQPRPRAPPQIGRRGSSNLQSLVMPDL